MFVWTLKGRCTTEKCRSSPMSNFLNFTHPFGLPSSIRSLPTLVYFGHRKSGYVLRQKIGYFCDQKVLISKNRGWQTLWRLCKMITGNPKCLFNSQVFFVIRLNGRKTPETSDPDPLMNCDIMDGRDAFLTLAREKHYEFSSLRRATFSTMAMLVELHNQGQDRFVYSCNLCKRPVETRYHCNDCEVFKQSLPSVIVNIFY